jgi:SOS-response transcriptional repressor LexA
MPRRSRYPVAVEGYHDGLAVVTGDLKAGDLVVVRGNERLMPGQAVAPKTEDGEQKTEDGEQKTED